MRPRRIDLQPEARDALAPVPRQQARQEPCIDLGGVAVVDRDAGVGQRLNEASNQREELRLLGLRDELLELPCFPMPR